MVEIPKLAIYSVLFGTLMVGLVGEFAYAKFRVELIRVATLILVIAPWVILVSVKNSWLAWPPW